MNASSRPNQDNQLPHVFRTSDNEHIMMPFPEFTSFFMIKQEHSSTDYFFPLLSMEDAGKPWNWRLQGRNKKIDKDRRVERYGWTDPINRMTQQVGMPMEEALAWTNIIDNLCPDLKAEIYSWWADMKVDAALVHNSCYVACLPCKVPQYTAFFKFVHEQALDDESVHEISAEYISEVWVRQRLDLLMWQVH